MEAIEIVRTQPQRQQRDIIEIQVGQDLQKQRNGKYIGVETGETSTGEKSPRKNPKNSISYTIWMMGSSSKKG